MSLVSTGLKKPIAVIVVTLGVLLFSVLAIFTIPIDIFPKLNLPTIYVIEPYGGMSPKQMEGFFATRMQDQFLYVNGIKNIESKNIQGISIIKLTFYESTDMAEASAQVALQVNRASAFFPPGALPPQVVRFDASSLPVGELVFSSPTRPLKDIYDLALTRVRPMFATVPGLSAPPPFGSNARSVIINIDPAKVRSYNLSPDQIVAAIAKNNSISPSGNIRINNTMYITTLNSLEEKVEAFDNIPVIANGNGTVFIRDIGKVSDAADITVDYALVNGRRSVYIPVVKTADASTWEVVSMLKGKLPEIQTLLPEDIKVSYEFDQSVFVINAVKSLMTEGILGALLTGLMVLLFLQDLRSSLIVIITIPVSILSAVMALRLAGQTINIMTLSGLALAIGVLVDQATVTIENIHQHLEMGKPKRQAIYDACEEISLPLLLILLCILAVFAPALIMKGVPKAMFLPLSLAIGFAMIASYFLAQAVVPVLANWMLKAEKFVYRHGHPHSHAGLALDVAERDEVTLHTRDEETVPEKNTGFEHFKIAYKRRIEKLMRFRGVTVGAYLLLVLGLAGVAFIFIGKDLMPRVNTGQFQLRLKEPDGTRLEVTEARLHDVLDIVSKLVDGHVAISSAFVGPVPTNFGSSNLYVFNSGTHEGILQVNLEEDYKVNMEDLKDRIRQKIAMKLPEMRISFEPIDLTEKIMSQGASTPIEVRVAGRDMKQIGNYAERLTAEMSKVSFLRDVQIAQPLKFPVININVDRFKAAQMGMNLSDVARSVTAATSSSRYTQKNLWLDERTSYTYQVQVQIPEYIMNQVSDLKEIPLVEGQQRPVLEDVANFSIDSVPGEYDRAGPRRYVTVIANIYKKDLASATAAVQQAISSLGDPPRGLVAEIKGTSGLLTETLDGLQTGLAIAIVVIFLLLAANYQSIKLSLAVLSTVPAVILGSLTALFVTGSTLNLQSYMGMIMSTGVSVANAILIVTNAEKLRLEDKDATVAATMSASIRLRPILMTSLAMIAGMIPMASGMGEAGDQTAPLGRAVIGGLIFSTLAALLILPQVYALIQRRSGFASPSLMPLVQGGVKLTVVGCLAIAGFAMTGCGHSATEKHVEGASAPSATAKFTVGDVVEGQLGATADLPAVLRPFESVDIYPWVSGFVREIPVDRGSGVRKGQLLVRLEAPEIEQQYFAARSKYLQVYALYLASKDNFDRLMVANKMPGTVSAHDLELARAKMIADSASTQGEIANYKALEANRNYLNVMAPFDGVITERNVHPGALVGPNLKTEDRPMLILQQESRLRLVVDVPEIYSNQLTERTVVTFRVSTLPGKVFKGAISRSAGSLNMKYRSEAIEVDVDNAGKLLKPGMYAEVQLPVIRNTMALIVPRSAVITSTEKKFVVVVTGDRKARRVDVTEGNSRNDSTEVFGELKAHDRVVMNPNDEIKDGDIIK